MSRRAFSRRYHILPFLVLLCALTLLALKTAAHADDSDPWPDLQTALFADRSITDGSSFMRLEAPARAYDAAVVPLEIKFDRQKMSGLSVKTITLVIDKNPAPIAAIFHLASDIPDPSIGTRIRVNEYTNIHAVAEMTDGRLFMAKIYVKAAGGCSAPAVKTPDSAAAHLGDMKIKMREAAASGKPSQVQLLIRHPNFSGMQMDQMTHYYIPAKYIQAADITYAGKTVMTIEGNISLSENPFFEFWLTPERTGELTVKAEDSDGGNFAHSWPLPPAS